MKFEQADYDLVEKHYTTTGALGYIITLGGKPFQGCNCKLVYNSKRSAMCALNNAIKWRIESIVREKLEALGMTHDEINRDADYRSAYKNFIAQAKADGFLKVIELRK